MKDLLVYVDSPARSQLFMAYAAYVARDLGLTVMFLNVITPPGIPSGMPGSVSTTAIAGHADTEQEVERVKRHFELQISKLNAADPDLTLLRYAIEIGMPGEIMKSICGTESVNMIMLGSDREHRILGDDSDMIDIIRKVKCPVWLVPNGITYKPFSEILYATDYHQEDIPNLKMLARFASRFPASITAVHVAAGRGFEERIKGEGFASMIKKETGYNMISLRILPERKGEPLVEEIHRFALAVDADLIVLLRENRGFFDRLFHGSRSEKIARETQLPVLILNEERS